jgi:hypothetical protein
VIAEALNSEDPTGPLHAETVSYMLSVGRKSRKEIPA